MITPDAAAGADPRPDDERRGVLDALVELVDTRDRTDPFHWLRDETNAHRRRHRCWAYPYADGTVLGVLVSALRPQTVLELGTALGYTACWWASQGADVDTIENDPTHLILAREHIERASPPGAVRVHEDDAAGNLSSTGTYDLVFFDAYEPPDDVLTTLGARVAAHGCLVVTNLELDAGRAQRAIQLDDSWTTHIVRDLALCVRRVPEDRSPGAHPT